MILWIVLVVVYLLYKWSTSNHDYFAKIGVPFEKPLPLVGNMLGMLLQRESFIELTQRSYNNFKGSKKFSFADDLGLTIQVIFFETAEKILEKDMKTMKLYYRKWCLCMNEGKSEVAIFHLNNKMATRPLNVYLDGKHIPFNKTPTYLGLPLDRSLTFEPALTKLSGKLKPRNNLVQKLVGTNWGANGNTLRTAVLSLVYSAAEYCSPVWYNSSHVNKVDTQLNIAMRTITGAVDSTPVPWLHVLSNIAPPHLRRKSAANKEWNKCFNGPTNYSLPMRIELEYPPPIRLTSRSPIWNDFTIQLHDFNINDNWKSYWTDSFDFTNKTLVQNPHEKLEGFNLERREWRILNRFRCGHGCCGQQMHRWNFVNSPSCDCDASTVQSMSHVLTDCPIRRFCGSLTDLNLVTTEAVEWLKGLDIQIYHTINNNCFVFYLDVAADRIFGIFNFNQTIFVLTDPELIKRITIKDFDHFVNHDQVLARVDRLFGKTLFGMHGQHWKDMRTTLSPMFTSSKMKFTFGLLSNHAKDFIQHFEKKSGSDGKNDIDVMEIFSRFAADGIATAALGFEGDCVKNENSFLYKMVKDILKDFAGNVGKMKFLLGFTMPTLYKALNMQLASQKTKDFFRRVVIDVMRERDRANITRPDIIQLMLQVKKGQLQTKDNEEVNDKEFDGFAAHEELNLRSNVKNLQEIVDDDEYWIAQGLIFFIAGFDTTSNLLQSISYHLARTPDIQEELYREISEVASALNGKQVTYEALHKMKFLDMVVSEGLRIQPPAPQIDRACSKDYTMDLGNGKSLDIKKDDVIFLPFYLLHHDSEYWVNPEKFDPYRFSDENKGSIVTGTYLPFGLGPRACIGSRFALMEAKLLIFNVLLNFKIVPSPRTPEKLTFTPDLNMRIKETVYLNFKRRS